MPISFVLMSYSLRRTREVPRKHINEGHRLSNLGLLNGLFIKQKLGELI